ncbi:MAG: helix-turn-helix transcriptional regulator [Hyphomicrobiales bacterium]
MAADRQPSHDLLTTRELADFLRLKERKIYDLVASGEVPHVRVSGKLLFPRTLIYAWLDRHTVPETRTPGDEPALVIAGSHDPLLEWALRESGAGIPSLFDSSLDGIERLARLDAMAAGIHIVEPDGYNVHAVAGRLAGRPIVLLEWATRSQGLLVAPGNPRGIQSPHHLAGARVALRQRSAGSFLLLERLLAEADLRVSDLAAIAGPFGSEAELALAIADGKADAGVGIEAMAKAFRLGFIPLARERYDLAVWRKSFFESPFQALMRFTRTPRFAERAAELGGYDISGLGGIRYNGGV